MKRAFVCMVLLVVSLTIAAHADIPQVLNYQGVLTDVGGTAVPDGTYNITFRLYTVFSGGTHIWEETNSVSVTKGIFNVVLGTLTSLNIDFDETYYMGISVEGNPELIPRIMLTSAAYSFAARSTYGAGNVLPSQGNVGIGTTSPDYDLHVYRDWNSITSLIVENPNTGASSAERLIFRDESGSNAGMIAFDDEHATSPSYLHLFNNRTDGEIHFITGAQRRMKIFNNGDVGIGTTTAAEKLEVGGAIKIGSTSNTNAGTIRWTGSDFQGYDGSSWKSLTATGGSTLPAGTMGQTLRHNGTDWVATSNLYNNGLLIGVGTPAPSASMHVHGSGDKDIRVQTTDATGSSILELLTTDGVYDYLRFVKHGPSSGGSIDGIPLADLGIICTGTMGGPMMIDVMTVNPMYFMTSNVERMRITSDGKVGINTKTPESTLHVNGTVSIGSDNMTGNLELYASGIATPVITMGSNTYGGGQYWMDENNIAMAGLYADPSSGGEGGYFYVKRNSTYSAFRVDGNYNDTESPRVSIFGAARTAIFDMTQSGDASISLPVDAVSSTEIHNEPGAASYTEGGPIGTTIGTTVTVIGSRSIVVPSSGYVLVMASGQVTMNHVNGTDSYCQFGVSDNNTAFPANQEITVGLNDTAPSGYYHMGSTFHGLFEVAGAGTYTYYFLGDETSGSFILYDAQLTLLYIPTSYGTVMPTMQGVAQEETRGEGRPGMTGTEIAAERTESEAANIARIERELAAMRAELQALRAEMKEE